MGRRVAALVLAVVGCRGETAPESPAAEPATKTQPTKVPPREPTPPASEVAEDEPSPSEPEAETPSGPALEADAVVADLRKRWPTYSAANLADNPSRETLDGLVATGKPSVTSRSCADAAKAAQSLLDRNDLLDGDITSVATRPGECWSVHIPGLMGPSIELILRPDGEVLLAVLILEG